MSMISANSSSCVSPAAIKPDLAKASALSEMQTSAAPAAPAVDTSQNELQLSDPAQGQAQPTVSFSDADEAAPSYDTTPNNSPETPVNKNQDRFGEIVPDAQKIMMGLGVLLANAPSRSYTPLLMQGVKPEINAMPPRDDAPQALNQARSNSASRQSEAIQNEAQERPTEPVPVPVLSQTQFPPRPEASEEEPTCTPE